MTANKQGKYTTMHEGSNNESSKNNQKDDVQTHEQGGPTGL